MREARTARDARRAPIIVVVLVLVVGGIVAGRAHSAPAAHTTAPVDAAQTAPSFTQSERALRHLYRREIECRQFGRRHSLFRQAVEPDVYVTDLDANGTRLSTPRRLTLDERADFPYSWTPDSKSVIFTSDRNGRFNIFRQGVHDAEPEILVRSDEDLAVPRLSPDGNSIIYLITPPNGASATEHPAQAGGRFTGQ